MAREQEKLSKDVLAVLDAPELGTAAADLAKARADAQLKKAALERMKSLFAAEVVPRRELEAAQADWQQAQAEAERAREQEANRRKALAEVISAGAVKSAA